MKIGILTYHRAHNYGALLQAYALQTYLRGLGHQVEIIDYWPNYHADEYKLFFFNAFMKHSFLGKCKFLFKFCLGLSRTIVRRKGNFHFMQDQLGLAKKPRYIIAKDIKEDYDIVIYGSDQIWRNQNTILFKGFDNAYFGQYPKNTKMRISYAASMGVIKLNVEDEKCIKQMLGYFNEIAVRESDLQILLKELGYNSHLVLDPVFLLNNCEWNSMIINIAPPKKKYILFYHLMYSKEALRIVEQIKSENGYDIYEIRNVVDPFLFGDRYKYQTSAPDKFLSLLKNAQFVVTTSFHGVAFSLLFKKQFYATGMANNSARTCNLLNAIGLEERYINLIENVNLSQIINYEDVNRKLHELIIASNEYITSQIEINI